MADRTKTARAIDKLIDRADTLAGAWGARARASTTLGQERALLRLYGVSGLDRAGRPLAGAAVDRWLASSRDGLASGIALPFAMALLEYDLDPQQLALDVASGAIDLALEAELLRERDRRELAIVEASRLIDAAVDRVDSDRVARRELLDLLGEAPRPWIGTTLSEPDVDGALDEAASLAGAGYDLLRVEVPIGRELAARMEAAGVDVPEWRPGHSQRRGGSVVGDVDESDPAPSGSQRALARLRRTADGVAAQRRAYVRLGTAIPPLGVPEGAVVAAFERVDLVEADPVAEIVVGGVDPDRSLADHAFARRLHRRSDTFVSIGPGPLVVAPDLVSGVPSDPATRSGRALALQLLGVALARADGLTVDRIVVGAYPDWLAEEQSATARMMAEVTVRRSLFPGQLIRFDEPTGDRAGRSSLAWPFVVAAALQRVGRLALVMRRAGAGAATAVEEARAAARIAADVADVADPGDLHGVADDHATAMLAAAATTLERLSELGWRAVVGDPPRAAGRGTEGRSSRAIGGDAVSERTEAFDPLAAFDPD